MPGRARPWHHAAAFITIRGAAAPDGRRGLIHPMLRFGKAAALIAVAAIALAGCESGGMASFGRREEPTVDPNALPARYKVEVSQYMRTSLADPTKVRDAYITEPALKPVSGSPRYVSCIRYNPRNPDGSYQGMQESVAIFFGGNITQFLKATPELCGRNLAYQRFPELEALVP